MSRSFNQQPQFFPDPDVTPGEVVWVRRREHEHDYCVFATSCDMVIPVLTNRHMFVVAVLRKQQTKHLKDCLRVALYSHVGAIVLLDYVSNELFCVPRIVQHGFRWPELLKCDAC